MSVIVRALRKKDLNAVLEIEGDLLNPWDLQDHKEWLRPERNVTAVATDGHHIYGFACATIMPRYVLVERVAVDDGFRRMGVGRGLLDSLQHWFVNTERRQMQVLVNEYAVDQQLFFKACGWKWADTRKWGDGPDEYFMVRDFA